MSRELTILVTAFCCLSISPAAAQSGIYIQDNFPGYAEYSGWIYTWNQGIGTTTFDATSPGFAHLNLAGPWSGPPDEYQNAEFTQYAIPPFYDFEVRLRNSNNNGWNAPGAPGTPDPTYGLGSRGWGFWDGNIANVQEAIWFLSLSPDSAPEVRGTAVNVRHGGVSVLVHDPAIDMTAWHTYRFQWRSDYIGIFIDDMQTPIAEITNPDQIPTTPMNITVWVDNYVVTGAPGNYSLGFLDVPAINQFIDVDYIKIYREPSLPVVPSFSGQGVAGLCLILVLIGHVTLSSSWRRQRA